MRLINVTLGACFGLFVASSSAATITFEGVGPENGFIDIDGPYAEAGYTLTPDISGNAALFGANTLSEGLTGDATASFIFNPAATILLTGPAPFDLLAVDLGSYSLSPSFTLGPTDVTLTADLYGGGTEVATFSGLTTETTETLSWTNLQDVQFSADNYTGIDNIVVQASAPVATPEPVAILPLGIGLGTLTLRRRRTRTD